VLAIRQGTRIQSSRAIYKELDSEQERCMQSFEHIDAIDPVVIVLF
jgi:hypothetical protein